MSERIAITTIFFDLGYTLVDTKRRAWLPGMKEGLDRLRAHNLRLGIISNTGDFTRDQLKEKYLPPDFAFSDFEDPLVILSGEVGLKKPDPEIWRLAAQRANERIDACLFVGEDLTETWFAQEAGMRSVRIGDLAKSTIYQGDPRIDMDELINLLGGGA
jgi:FMN phosphatase YigB (HAD superfamily)